MDLPHTLVLALLAIMTSTATAFSDQPPVAASNDWRPFSSVEGDDQLPKKAVCHAINPNKADVRTTPRAKQIEVLARINLNRHRESTHAYRHPLQALQGTVSFELTPLIQAPDFSGEFVQNAAKPKSDGISLSVHHSLTQTDGAAHLDACLVDASPAHSNKRS